MESCGYPGKEIKSKPAEIARARARLLWNRRRPDSGRNRALITVATGSEFLDILMLTRPFMQEYCERVNADLIDLTNHTEHWAPMEKFRVRYFAEHYDEVLFVDTDAVITDRCPNLFEMHKEDIVIHEDWPKLRTVQWLFRERHAVAAQSGAPIDANLRTCLNSGIILTRHSARSIWDRPTVQIGTTHCAEQIWLEHKILNMVNCGAAKLGHLDSRANWQWWFSNHSRGFFESGLSEAWIVHFANAPNKCKTIREFIETL